MNISDQTIDLAGAELTQVETDDGEEGVSFRFADGAVTTLLPGQRVVVVEDLEAFEDSLRQPGLRSPDSGRGRLSNGEELITLSALRRRHPAVSLPG